MVKLLFTPSDVLIKKFNLDKEYLFIYNLEMLEKYNLKFDKNKYVCDSIYHKYLNGINKNIINYIQDYLI
jgi:hypothetical protein